MIIREPPESHLVADLGGKGHYYPPEHPELYLLVKQGILIHEAAPELNELIGRVCDKPPRDFDILRVWLNDIGMLEFEFMQPRKYSKTDWILPEEDKPDEIYEEEEEETP